MSIILHNGLLFYPPASRRRGNAARLMLKVPTVSMSITVCLCRCMRPCTREERTRGVSSWPCRAGPSNTPYEAHTHLETLRLQVLGRGKEVPRGAVHQDAQRSLMGIVGNKFMRPVKINFSETLVTPPC